MPKMLAIAALFLLSGFFATSLEAQESCGSPSTFCPDSSVCTQTYNQCASVAFRCNGQSEAAAGATPWCELHCTVSTSCVASIETDPRAACNASSDCARAESCLNGLCQRLPAGCPDCPQTSCPEPEVDPLPVRECASEAQCVFGQACTDGKCHGCPAGQVWVRPSEGSSGAQCIDHPVRSCADNSDCTGIETCARVIGFGGSACIFNFATLPPGEIDQRPQID